MEEFDDKLWEQFYIPGDGNCLYWAVTMAYLIPVKDDDKPFLERFCKLFGISESEAIKMVHSVNNLMKTYNPFITSYSLHNEHVVTHLVTSVFRTRIVDYMKGHEDEFKQCIEGENGCAFEEYLEKMKTPGVWGGEQEIRAMSQVLGITIRVNSEGAISEYKHGDEEINIFHVRLCDSGKLSVCTHYNLSLKKTIADEYRSNVQHIAKHIIEKGSNNISLTSEQKDSLLQSIIRPNFQNDYQIMYNVVCFGNPQLLDICIQLRQYHLPISSQKLEKLLSLVYEELKLDNPCVLSEIEFHIVNKLITLRSRAKRGDDEIDEQSVKKRIDMVCKEMDNLYVEYSGENGSNVDEKFLFVTRFVAQNIHVLKGQLRSTYDKLPWEEIEFCLVAFILSHKNQEVSIIYKLVLDKETLLKHLNHFSKVLGDIKLNVNISDINSKFPVPINTKEGISPRNAAIIAIIENNSSFKELYSDFELVRSAYSITRIHYYVDEALSVNLKDRKELGKLVIERTLQVIGESLRNTLDSPNVSDDINKFLHEVAPRDLKQIISSLRDSLSHTDVFSDTIDNKDLEFYYNIRNDLRKIKIETNDILYYLELLAIRNYLDHADSFKDLSIFELLPDSMCSQNSQKKSSDDYDINEVLEINKMVEYISYNIPDQTEEEKRLFDGIGHFKNIRGLYIASNKMETMTGLAELALPKRKELVEQLLLKLKRRFLEANRICQVQGNILNIYKSFEQRTKEDMASELLSAIFNCLYDTPLKARKIGVIDEWRQILENKEKDVVDVLEVKEILDEIEGRILDEKKRNLFQREREKKIQTHEKKLILITQLERIAEAKVKCNPNIHQLKIVVDLLNDLGLNNKLKNEILNICEPSSQIESCELIQKIQKQVKDSYGKLVNCFDNGQKAYLTERTKKPFQRFIISFTNGNELINIANTIFEENMEIQDPVEKQEEVQTYFQKRLKLLKSILFSKSDHLKEKKLYQGDNKLQIAMEMLVLDLIETLKKLADIGDFGQLLDTRSPILFGISLRNYLAHGDPIFDILPHNTSIAIYCNAVKFVSDGEMFLSENECSQYQDSGDSISDLNDRFQFAYQIIKTQIEMSAVFKYDIFENFTRYSKKWNALNGSNNFRTIETRSLRVTEKINHLENTTNLKRHVNECKLYIKAINAELLSEKNFCNAAVCLEKNITRNHITALHLAAVIGHEGITNILLKNDEEIDAGKFTPLHLATFMGHNDIVKVLIAKRSDASCHSKSNFVSFILDVKVHLQEWLKSSMEDKIDSVISKCNNTEMITAIQNSWKGLCDLLLMEYDNLFDNFTPLHFASCLGHADIVETLLQAGANVNIKCGNGFTPLYYAVGSGQIDIVQFLLQRGSDICFEQKHMFTPLHLAACTGRKDIAALLLEHAIIMNFQNVSLLSAPETLPLTAKWSIGTQTRDRTPFHKTTRSNKQSVNNQKRTKIDFPDEDGRTPLHIASWNGCHDIVNILLDKGTNVNIQDKCGLRPLHWAIAMGHEKIVTALLENDADVNSITDDLIVPLHIAEPISNNEIVKQLLQNKQVVVMKTDCNFAPLHLAVIYGHKQIVNTLLKFNANINAVTKDKETPLHLAASIVDNEIANILLLNNANVNAQDIHHMTPLHKAASYGHNNTANALLENGAKVNIRNTDNWTPLHMASKNGDNPVVVNLLNHDADVNAVDREQLTPLHIAVKCNNVKVAVTLLGRVAKINAECKKKSTPLHYAVNNCREDLTDILLINGADVNAEDQYIRTPLHYAADSGYLMLPLHGNVAVLNNCKSIVNKLLQYGANIDTRDQDGRTPLHCASLVNDKEIARTLLRNSAAVNVKDGLFSSTPLHCAVSMGHKDVAMTLIEHNADINSLNELRHTPLHIAAIYGHDDIVVLLLQNHAKVDAEMKYNLTPLHLAVLQGQRQVVNTLLGYKSNVNAVNTAGETALHFAASSGDMEIVKILLQENADVNVQEYRCHFTPLHCAAHRGYREVAVALLQSKANVDLTSKSNCTPLHVASCSGYSDLVVVLLDNNADIHSRDKNNSTPLHQAAVHNHKKVAQILIKKRANVNTVCDKRRTPLHAAASFGSQDVTKILLEYGADIDAKDTEGDTAIHLAAINGSSSVVKLLLKKGANVNAKDNIDRTPIYFPTHEGHLDVVKILLENGADCLAHNSQDSVLHRAVRSNNKQIVELILNKIKECLQGNVQEMNQVVNIPDDHGNTPLILASAKGNVDSINLLLEYGADVHEKNNLSYTALHHAVKYGNLNVVMLLLNKGINVNARNDNDVTAVHAAAVVGHFDVLDILLEHGADIDAKNTNGTTALHLAALYGHSNIVVLLLNKGANINDKDNQDIAPIHLAAIEGELDVLRILLENGADCLASVVLHYALASNNEEVVELVLRNVKERLHGNVQKINRHINNALDNNGNTLLTVASTEGNINSINVLLEYGVDIDAKAINGRTALHTAASMGNSNVVMLLLKKGANVNDIDNQYVTPLHCAAAHGHLDVFQILLENGADCLTRTANETVLHQAVSGNNEQIVNIILNKINERLHGNDQEIKQLINAADTDGDTPLSWAAESGRLDLVRILLSQGVNIDVQNNDGMTALHWAASRGHSKVFELLLNYRANYELKTNEEKMALDLIQESTTLDNDKQEELKTILSHF